MKTYSNQHLTVTVECGVHLLRQTWVGLPTSAFYREGSVACLALAERHRVKRWLIDLRQLRMFNPIDLQWFTQEWLPEAAIRLPRDPRIAVILHEKYQFGKLGSDLVLRAALHHNEAIASRYFLDDTDARCWLLASF